MENKYWLEEQIESVKNDPEFQLEEFKLEVTENICRIMKEQKISRKELAKKLECSSAYITKMLSGGENLTIGTLFKIVYVLGYKPTLGLIPQGFVCKTYVEPLKGKSIAIDVYNKALPEFEFPFKGEEIENQFAYQEAMNQ